MRRRNFVAMSGAGLFAPLQRERPNILFLLTDDQRKDTISALGNPHIRTPNMDGLVRSGVSFRNGYCMGGFSPAVCLPSRMMMQRGVSWFTVQRQAEPKPCIAQTMNDAGYITYHIGKRGNEDTKAHKFYQYNNYVEPDDTTERLAGKPSRQMADKVTAFLKEWKKDKPFFMYLADSAPHDPRVAPPEYLAQYDPEKIPVPRNFKPFHPFDNGEMLIRDEKLAAWPRTETEIRRHLRDYYAVITYMDEQIGRIFRRLKEIGEYDNTYIAFASDQGIAIGSHGLMGKQNLYQPSMNAPLIFAGPGIPRGKAVDGFAYLFDIYPTLCDFASIEKPSGLEGISQADVIRGKSKSVRDTIFLAYRDFQRGVRQGPWKLLRYPQVDRTQLFNLDEDPDELQDLAANPAQQPRVRELMTLLTEQQKRYGDTAPLHVPNPKRGDITSDFFRSS